MADKIFKGVAILLGILLLVVLWRGVPVRLSLLNSGIPLHVSGISTPNNGEFEMVTVPYGPGGYVLRLDRYTGKIDVFHLDDQGKLTPTDSKR